MTNWSVDILRQSGWDWWLWVCVVAAGILCLYATVGRIWRRPGGWVALPLIAVGVVGTLVVLVGPQFHTPWTGLVWTLAMLCLLSAVFYLNLRPQLGARRMSVLLAMRILTLGLLVPMLFEPVARYVTRPRPQRPLMVLVDASGSMSFPDVQNGPTRVQSAWQALRPQIRRMNDHFVPQYFTFATNLTPLRRPDDLASASADGKATDIAGALVKVRPRITRDDGVIVLISDGIDNTSSKIPAQARGLGVPVYTLRVGSEQTEPATLANVAVDNIEAEDDFAVGHESLARATIKSTALPDRVVTVKLSEVDEAGKPMGTLTSQNLVLKPVPEGQTVDLPYKPESIGVHRLAVWVDPVPGERSTADNRQEFQGLAMDPRIRVLYIEGRVRDEYKHLTRAMGRDPNVESATLLRIAGERFSAGGTVDGKPFKQMPQALEEWKRFDVIILGDLDSSFLPKVQQERIEQTVSEGGALLMLGGENSFGPGAYKDTLIERALPMFVGEVGSPQEKTQFVPRLTADGAAHPAMEGLAEWFGVGDTKPGKELPPLRGNVVVGKPKSGAQVLANNPLRPGPDGQPQITLAVQRYGKGRSAAFTADTTWQWYIELRRMNQDNPYNRFWGQLIRWLAGEDVRNRQRGAGVDGMLNKSWYQLGEDVRIRAMVRDERGDATPYAQATLVLRSAGQEPRQIPLSPVASRAGLYEAIVEKPDKGDHAIELSASKEGKPLGRCELKFTVVPPAEELLKIAANPAALAAIASETRGSAYELAQLPALIDELIRTDVNAVTARQETVSLANTPRTLLALLGHNPQWPGRYDLPIQAALVVSLLSIEWILRRRWQLA